MMHVMLALMQGQGAVGGLFAYLDPGTGSLILQGILAGIAMSAVMLKMFWRRILVFLRLRPPPESLAQEGASSEKNE